MESSRRHTTHSPQTRERTHLMHRSVREILEAQGQGHLLDASAFVPASEAETLPPRPMPSVRHMMQESEVCGLQRPPRIHGAISPARTAPPAPVEPQRTFLSRLLRRRFSSK